MKSGQEFLESGLLELYVLGQTSPEETIAIQALAKSDETIRKEISEIEISLEKYALSQAIEPNPIVKPFLMAMIDYSDRIQAGEIVVAAPLLHNNSAISDYDEWLTRSDMTFAYDLNDVYAKIISFTPEVVTAIVWIKEMAPQEVHDDQFEKFLIIEGTCDITIDKDIYHLIPGDFLSIPLHKSHHITVTSSNPCKAILQRVAA